MNQEQKPGEEIVTRTTVIQFAPDYRPASIDLPVSLSFYRDPDDESAVGSSDLSVLLDALNSYRKAVKKWPDTSDKTVTLSTIRDIESLLLERTWERLSQVTGLLHAVRHGLNNPRRYEPLA
ncbi:hypothetical protein [Fibrella forsythiae]|uniref:Uncharacterized protein n=1 Tax=Fibrella forsythiae TaxID=2817061 RepID=A0ABS3JBY4_9BACT|nr:hypothetical protein [Fibrella forsythiae]MBO0947513.1 hypothetical protein [Fibrella forsythiae]